MTGRNTYHYSLDIPVDPNDELLPPYRLDLAAMKEHKFVTTRSHPGNIVYRMLFSDGDEKEVPLPQTALFSIHKRPWSLAWFPWAAG